MFIFCFYLNAYFYCESVLALFYFSFEFSVVVHLRVEFAFELLRDKLQQILGLGNCNV